VEFLGLIPTDEGAGRDPERGHSVYHGARGGGGGMASYGGPNPDPNPSPKPNPKP
jgi:hypothetical protein